MVADVLDALAEIDGIDEIVMVTSEPRAAAAGEQAGAVLVDDPVEAGQSVAAARGVAAALRRSAGRALLVPGDCPALDPGEVGALLARPPGHAPGGHVTIVPDRHGRGTNALLLAPVDVLEPAFGPGSLARHAAQASAAGARVRIAACPSLELDVDTPGDLAALDAALGARPGVAPRTRAVLSRLAPLAPIAS